MNECSSVGQSVLFFCREKALRGRSRFNDTAAACQFVDVKGEAPLESRQGNITCHTALCYI